MHRRTRAPHTPEPNVCTWHCLGVLTVHELRNGIQASGSLMLQYIIYMSTPTFDTSVPLRRDSFIVVCQHGII